MGGWPRSADREAAGAPEDGFKTVRPWGGRPEKGPSSGLRKQSRAGGWGMPPGGRLKSEQLGAPCAPLLGGWFRWGGDAGTGPRAQGQWMATLG